MYSVNFVLFFLTVFTSLGSPKPIMVSFGTNEGPIVPRPTTTTLPPKIDTNPAPVFEKPEDIPNPSIYKPLVPHQYRSKIFSYKPHPNLILGTPLDIKYTPSINKYTHRKRQLKSLGIGYRGPQVFDKQDYEFELEKRRSPSLAVQTADSRSISEDRSDYQSDDQGNLVPQIGVIYSSGLRYYVPQIYDYSSEDDNSVYDRDDQKYYHQSKEYYY